MHIQRSSRVEELFEALADVVSQPLDDPFTPDVIVVDSPGIERWLSLKLSERLGICANVEFPSPTELIAQLQRAVRPDAEPVWDEGALTWAIAAVLVNQDDPALDIPRGYITTDHGIDDRRLIQLSLRLSDLLQRYALYRPNLTTGWERGEAPDDWQASLWRHLCERLGPNHAGRALADLVTAVSQAPLEVLPARLSVFDIASLPPAFVRVLDALGKRRPVSLFVPTPSGAGWSNHPLLRSLGGLGRDLLDQLGRPMPAHTPSAPPSTLLGTLQADLLADRAPSEAEHDDTLRLIACHGPSRQLEVLRDEIVRRLDADPTLQPRDIVVMCPDIEAYAPLIDAVFSDDSKASGYPALPYRLADLTLRRENPVAEALTALLALPGSRLRVREVLDLLALEPIRRRFGIDPDDLDTLHNWVAEVGIRWGADAAHRASFGRPERPEGTWRHGLDRLLSGVALDGAEPRLWRGLWPAAHLEGGALTLLGRFVDFAETLLEQLVDLDQARTLPEWRARLTTLCDAMLGTTDREGWLRRQVDAEIDAFTTAAEGAGLHRALGLAGIRAALDGSLQVVRSTPAFISGGITFCTLTPMRSIPFRVVALLGLDDESFPRRGSRLAFDLIAQHPQPGDRNLRADDRYLFLEALSAARDHLIVTWTGTDPSDGKDRPPATVVQQLVDCLSAMTGKTDLIEASPLHPWSAALFHGDQRSFDTRMLQVAQTLLGEPTTPAPLLDDALSPPASPTVSPEALASFFDSPIRALLRRRLGLSLDDEDDTLAEEDPTDLSGLERWKVGSLLLSRRLAGDPSEAAQGLAKAQGLLPLGTPGALALSDAEQRAGDLLEHALPLISGRPRAVLLDEVVDGVQLVGAVPDVYATGRTVVQFGRVHDRQLMRLWVHHVLLCAFDPTFSGRSWIVGHHRQPIQGFGPLGSDALPIARTLISAWLQGQQIALPFAPTTARAYLESDDLEFAAHIWWRDDRGGACSYVARALGPDYEPDERFAELARQLMGPMLARLEA